MVSSKGGTGTYEGWKFQQDQWLRWATSNDLTFGISAKFRVIQKCSLSRRFCGPSYDLFRHFGPERAFRTGPNAEPGRNSAHQNFSEPWPTLYDPKVLRTLRIWDQIRRSVGITSRDPSKPDRSILVSRPDSSDPTQSHRNSNSPCDFGPGNPKQGPDHYSSSYNG